MTPTLTRVSDQAMRQTRWREWLDERLPQELSRHLSGVVEREGTLTVFAESAVWSARLRYAMQELEPLVRETQPDIQHVAVRVLPKS